MANVPEATWLRQDSKSRQREAPRLGVWCAPPPSEFRPFPSLPRTSEDFKVWTEAFLQARIFLDPCPAPPIPPYVKPQRTYPALSFRCQVEPRE